LEESIWNGPEEKRHILTEEDSRRGGQTVTERKREANAVRNLKHGKYSKALDGFEFCDSCVYKDSCMAFKPGQACPLRLTLLREVNKVAGPEGAQSWLNVMLRGMQDLYVLSKTSEDPTAALQKYLKLWIEFGRIMFPRKIEVSGKDQEIRVIFGEGKKDDADSDD